MQAPTRADYVRTYFTLFAYFQQEREHMVHYGHPFEYADQILIVFFTMMSIRRITAFKAQHRWLLYHLHEAIALGFEKIPHRVTLSRRYKALYPILQAFIAFVGSWAETLHPELDSRVLIEDASLFKAHGPVWHQSDRLAGKIPDKLRNLDQDASWRKSAYHGWVYGYSLHLTCNRSGFPKLAQVETACISESQVLEEKKQALFAPDPFAITGDNAYFKALRVRKWAAEGAILLTPAVKWQNGRYAAAYHRFIARAPFKNWLKCRKTAIEPVFDLFSKRLFNKSTNMSQLCHSEPLSDEESQVTSRFSAKKGRFFAPTVAQNDTCNTFQTASKVLGTTNNHKQLPLQWLTKVRTFLCLGVLAVQIAMIVNNAFGLPLREISNFLTAFS